MHGRSLPPRARVSRCSSTGSFVETVSWPATASARCWWGVGLFLGFAFFFEGVIGLSGHRIANLDEVLPYVVIGFGVLLVVSSLFGGGNRDRRHRRDQQA